MPDPLGLLPHQPGDNLRDRAKHFRHCIRELGVPQDVPLGHAAHHRRLDCENDASDSRLSRRECTHRARLDGRIERAIGQILVAKTMLRFRDRNHLGMTRYVVGSGDLIGCLHQNLRVAADQTGKRHLSLLDSFCRKANAALHHRFVDGRSVAVRSVRFCNHSVGPIAIKQSLNEACPNCGPRPSTGTR